MLFPDVYPVFRCGNNRQVNGFQFICSTHFSKSIEVEFFTNFVCFIDRQLIVHDKKTQKSSANHGTRRRLKWLSTWSTMDYLFWPAARSYITSQFTRKGCIVSRVDACLRQWEQGQCRGKLVIETWLMLLDPRLAGLKWRDFCYLRQIDKGWAFRMYHRTYTRVEVIQTWPIPLFNQINSSLTMNQRPSVYPFPRISDPVGHSHLR